jgi:hypothetical protein
MNMHHKMRRLGALLITMQLLIACNRISAKEQEAVTALNAFTHNRPEMKVGPFESPVIPGALDISIIQSGVFSVEEWDDYVIHTIPYSITAIEGYDGPGKPLVGTDTPEFKLYGPEETGPMLFVYREGKLYTASEPARMYAPELEYFELPQEAIGK